MPESNLLRSITFLMDCFVKDYSGEVSKESVNELDLRAQIEVNYV